MSKKKINAKEAVADIRSGMDDSNLMSKYGLAHDGLQSLFDKLVTSGYIDVAEIQGRMPGYLGTVSIGDVPSTKREGTQSKGLWINAQEAARDVRSGLDDEALMEKYHVTSRGVQSLLDKLVTVGLITQADLDRRALGLEQHTVALSEEMLNLTYILKHLEQEQATSRAEKKDPPEPSIAVQPAKDNTPKKALPVNNNNEKPRKPVHGTRSDPRWHDNSFLAIVLLIVFFPLGFYALYLNSRMTRRVKGLMITIWSVLVIACLILIAYK
ncbi:MAG: hypothetical protein HY913_23430 [Desulfomonile tiedjei]|nr:hypothetical protein [Desulfomonile tiedjei]